MAAASLRALGRSEQAIDAELQGIRFGFAPPLKLARAAQQEGRSSEAKSIADDYLRTNPGDLVAMTIASEANLRLEGADAAERMLSEVVARAPAFPPANLLLANVLAGQLRLQEAAEILESLLKRVPHEVSGKRYLADLRAQLNDPAAAAALYKDILRSQPNNPADQSKYADFLRSAGSRSESIAALRRSVALAPLHGYAWWALAHYFPDELTAEDERQIRSAAATAGVQPGDLGFLQLALSILEHQRGNCEAAVDAVDLAKTLLPVGSGYDSAFLTRHVNELIATYTPQTFARFQSQALRCDSPIFIVGMPRSGSTLLERILGRHSKIEAIGEIAAMPRVVGAEQSDHKARHRSLLPYSLTGEKLREKAEWYLERAGEYRHTDKPHFIDKYNGNWIRAGLIRLMFPKAKILDIRRNALDCCWAVYKSVLVGDYSNDQRDLAAYYADYVRYMDAMSAASPGTILTISYEDLIADVERQTRRVLDFLGLEFDQACIAFHLSTDAVRTASSEQVRRPLNSESIGSAEPYRPWLQPLIEEIESRLGAQPQ